MNTWAPIWSGIVESSIWDESDTVVKVFMTMLAVKDSDHIVRKSAYQLSRLSRKSETEVLDALKVLASPDTRRTEQQEHEGRRIQLVEDGWLVLNGEKYRQKISREMTRARNARAQAAFRERQKRRHNLSSGQPLPGEQEYLKAIQRGASKEELLQIEMKWAPKSKTTTQPEPAESHPED